MTSDTDEYRSGASGTDRSAERRANRTRTNDAARSRAEIEAALREARSEISAHVRGIRRELEFPRLRLGERIREHPVATVLGALLLGGVIGRLLRGDGREPREEGDVESVLAHAIDEVRALAEDGRLDEDAIAEIERRYEGVLRAATSGDGSSGSTSGLLGFVLGAVGRRLVREGMDRFLPRLLDELDRSFFGADEVTEAEGPV